MYRTRWLGPLALLPVLAASPAAQFIPQHVAPPGYENSEGTGVTSNPFGLGASTRLQIIYHGTAVPVTSAKAIAMRGNAGVTHAGNPQVEVEILAGGSMLAPFSMQRSFAANRGPDVITVFGRKCVNLPPLAGTQTPQPFDIVFPLDVPMSRNQSPHVLVEFVVHNGGLAPFGYDVDSTTFGPQSIAATGASCGTASLVASGSVQPVGGGLTMFMRSSGFSFGNGIGLALFGSGPLPVSVPLPGGACALHQDILGLVLVGLDSSGGAMLNLPLPSCSKGVELQLQFVAADAALTKTASSASWRLTVGGAEAAAVNWPSSFSHTVGNVQMGVAPVLAFGQ